MKLKVLSITDTEQILSEYVAALGTMFPVEGIWDKEDGWDIYLPQHITGTSIDEITGFLNRLTKEPIQFRLYDYDDDDTDWNAEWKKGYEPVKISNNLYVFPAWIEIPEEMRQKTVIRIDPQMGFGTGTHETTRLMLEMTEKHFSGYTQVLDAGTGSGILAVLTEKLMPAARIIAFDVDEDAIANARINGRLNQCTRISWVTGDIHQMDPGNFDYIMANINRTVLMDLIPELTRRLMPCGLLLLSGILNEEVSMIRELCASLGLTEADLRSRNEWSAMVWRMPPV